MFMFRNIFAPKWEYETTQKFVTTPGETIVIDSFASKQGEYVFHLEIEALQMSDEISVAILYRPSPRSDELLYDNIPIPFERNARLWKFEVPVCSGVVVKVTQRNGIEKRAALHVWRRS